MKTTYSIPFYIALTFLFLALFLMSWYTIDILLLTFAGILLAIFFRTLNDFFRKFTHLSDSVSLTLVLLILAAISIFAITTAAPLMSEQFGELVKEIPAAWENLKERLNSFLNLHAIDTLYSDIDFKKYLPQAQTLVLQAANLFSTTLGLVGSFFVFLFIGVLLAFDPDTYKEGLISLVPPSKQKTARETLELITVALRSWIMGKIYSMAVIGILTFLGLWLLGIPLALVLGIIAALLSFIPNIGPVLSAIPAILVALVQSPLAAFNVIILFIAIQMIETYILTPFIQKKTMSLPPALVIFAQLIMAFFTGIIGLALATPLLAVVIILIKKLYIRYE